MRGITLAELSDLRSITGNGVVSNVRGRPVALAADTCECGDEPPASQVSVIANALRLRHGRLRQARPSVAED